MIVRSTIHIFNDVTIRQTVAGKTIMFGGSGLKPSVEWAVGAGVVQSQLEHEYGF